MDLSSSTPIGFHRSLLTDTNPRPARTQRRPQTQICPSSSSSSSPTDVVPFLSRQICRLKKMETTNQTRERIWTKRKLKINCYLCVFLLLQVTVIFTAGKEGNRGGNCSRSPYSLRLSLRRRMNPSATSSGHTWRRRAATVPTLQGFLSTAPQSYKLHWCPQHCSRFPATIVFTVGGLFFVNFKCWNMYVNYC